jgi:cell division protein FtsX
MNKFQKTQVAKAEEIVKAIKTVAGVESVEYDTSDDHRLQLTVYLNYKVKKMRT